MSKNLQGVIDLHIHSAPDIRERKHNDLELIKQAVNLNVRAIVLKSHQFPTTERAWLLNKLNENVKVFGSITLNYAVGGLNPTAVKYALELGAKTVWLPTIDAHNHRLKEGKNGGIEILDQGEIVPDLKEILLLIKQYDAILGTGHISPKEIRRIVQEAHQLGMGKIVITHPEFHIVNLSLSEQKELASKYNNVYFERTFAQPISDGKYSSNLEANLLAIKEVGYRTTIVSTDSGQIQNPPWDESLPSYIQYLRDHAVEENELDWMTKHLPANLLNLEEDISNEKTI